MFIELETGQYALKHVALVNKATSFKLLNESFTILRFLCLQNLFHMKKVIWLIFTNLH